MKTIIQLFLLLALAMHGLSAQKILQMDINGFGGRTQFFIGDQLEFQLDGQPDWYRYTISDLDPSTQEIIFDDMRVPLSRITKLYVIRKQTKVGVLSFSSMLSTFGLTWTVYAIYGTIVASPAVGVVTFIVGGVAMAVGAGLFWAKFLWKRKYRITSKRRLRIVDITIYPKAAFRPSPNGPIPFA